MFRNGGDPYCLSGSQTQPYPSNRVIDDPRYTDEYPSPIPIKKKQKMVMKSIPNQCVSDDAFFIFIYFYLKVK